MICDSRWDIIHPMSTKNLDIGTITEAFAVMGWYLRDRDEKIDPVATARIPEAIEAILAGRTP